jgi:hypothetical protein
MIHTQISIRVDEEVLRRADELVEPVSAMHDARVFRAVTRSAVLRLALIRGLELLETEVASSQN